MDMVGRKENGESLELFLSGRIDSSNAADARRKLMEAVSNADGKQIALNLRKLQYISSVGLRILLELERHFSGVVLRDVPTEIYEILEMTGFTEILTVERALREISIADCALIGIGTGSRVYRLDPETVVKVFGEQDALARIQRERELSRKAFVLGIPTAIPFDTVRVGEHLGAVYELLDARSLAQCIHAEPQRLEEFIDISVSLLKTIHGTRMAPGTLTNKKETVLRSITEPVKKTLGRELCEALMVQLNGIPDSSGMVHGDFHIKNIVMQDGTPMLIDMETIGYGAPILDMALLHRAYVGFPEILPDNAMRFFGLSRETCEYIWKETLRRYYAGEPEAVLQRNMHLSALISYAILMDWVDRHQADTPEKRSDNLQYLRERIREQLNRLT